MITEPFYELLETCPGCGSAEPGQIVWVPLDSLVVDLKRSGWLSPHFPAVQNHLVKCSHCDLVYLNPRLSEASLTEIYSAWYTARLNLVDFPAISAEQIGEMRRFHVRHLKRWAPPPARLLDVGCGIGVMLQVCQSLGWDVSGVEWSAPAVTYACQRGLDVHLAKFSQSTLPHQSYDVLTMFDYLEHTPTLQDDLHLAQAYLRPGGRLVGRVPRLDSAQARLMHAQWLGIISPHLYYFNCRTLTHVLSIAGFRQVIISDGNAISLGQILRQRWRLIRRVLSRSAKSLIPGPYATSSAIPILSKVGMWSASQIFSYSLGIELLDYLASKFGLGNTMFFVAIS